MASTFSPSLRIELIGDGDQSGIWGQTTNNNLGALIEQAIAGVVTITMADANYTMTNFNGVTDEARNQVIVLEGTNTAQRNLIAPLVEKTYTVKNTTTGGFAVQIIGASGTGVIIPNGQTVPVYCDGTNFYGLVTGSSGNFNIPGNLAVTGTSTFTGIPTGPTAALGTNTTQLATTAFATAAAIAAFPSGGIIMWSGSIASIPSGWLLCNGTSGTPDLRDRFVVGAGTTYAVGATGGVAATTLIEANLPSHTHSISASGTTAATNIDHTHNGTTNNTDVNHTHFYSGTTGGMNANNPHTHTTYGPFGGGGNPGGSLNTAWPGGTNFSAITSTDINHGHDYSGNTGFSNQSINHAHTFTSGTMNSNTTHTHTVTVTGTSGATGSGTAFSNLPPYYALAYIMKA